jgi:hypothetical protein
MPSFVPPQDPASHLSDVAVACPELLEQVRNGKEGGRREGGRERIQGGGIAYLRDGASTDSRMHAELLSSITFSFFLFSLLAFLRSSISSVPGSCAPSLSRLVPSSISLIAKRCGVPFTSGGLPPLLASSKIGKSVIF